MTLRVKQLLLVMAISALLIPMIGQNAQAATSKEATKHTIKTNAALLKILPFAEKQDFEEAEKGFIAPLPNEGVIKNAKGEPVWDMTKFKFILDIADAPDSVNPSLWRQMKLVMKGGLFKICDGIYQVRNADLSNMTFIEGKKGVILVDPLISAETAKAALDLYFQHRPRKPITAMIYSHSHIDHFGGARGVVSAEDVKSGKVKVYAPEGFLDAAIAENVLAGTAMSRRASYMYGNLLPPSPKGQVGAGLGTTTSTGTVTLIPPTNLITKTGQKITIDGLDFVFMLAPGSEAPSEMFWYIPEYKALTAAEDCVHTLHNTYTLRGAKIRDPLLWSKYLNESIKRWGDKTEVLYGMHHWPVWGKKRVMEMLRFGRDGYRLLNDQTLRLANEGHTPDEIAEMISFPKGLAQHWAMRGYYGSIYHNVKATYVYYLGWFDGNPSNLHTLPPVPAAKKYVEYMGGADAVMKKAQKAYANGEYRWVAEVMNKVVFADPTNKEAKELTADALEQMGYQAESGPWRNFYLTGAKELREGVKALSTPNTASPDMIRAMDTELFFDYMGVRLNVEKAGLTQSTFNIIFPDTKEKFVLELENGALNNLKGAQSAKPDATVTLNRTILDEIMLGKTTLKKEIDAGKVTVAGNNKKFDDMLGMFDTFKFWFNIVTP